MSPNIPTELDARGSILFLGSGFSRSAKNVRGHNLPTSQELSEEFAKLLNVDPNAYDMMTLADEIAAQPRVSLYQTLYQLFTVQKTTKDQNDILGLPWNRIYTTNYDDSVEFAYAIVGKNAPSYNYDDTKPRRLAAGSVIHLHGVIRKTTEDNVLQQLVLNESSYARQHFERSEWYDDFIRDLRFCSSCYFIGYKLADYHIASLLMQDPSAPERTFFVTSKTPDPIFCNRTRSYGTTLPIEMSGFAALCRDLPAHSYSASPHALKAFQYMDPIRDKKTLTPPTAMEVLNLITYGTFNEERCLTTLPRGEYVVPRQELAAEAAAKLQEARCLLVHSRLGNGKSIFLYILAHMLSQRGYRCFRSLNEALFLQRDVEILKTFHKSAIFFDSYDSAIVFIEQMSELPPDTKFVVTIRTSVQDVRLHEIRSKLPAPLERIDLNGIQRKDVDALRTLLDTSGLGIEEAKVVLRRAKDFRDVVVGLYKNAYIKEKIEREFGPLLEDREFRDVFIVSHLVKWIGHDVSAAFARSVTHSDAYAAIAKHRELAGDVFLLNDDNIYVRSSIFAEYLIQNHLATSDVVECVYSIVVEAVKRKSSRPYQGILSSLMRVSLLNRALSGDPDRLVAMKRLFERLRRDVDVNREPLFWLQYSILMTEDEDLVTAETFIRNAYSKALNSPGFHTFQIDTYALKLFLLIERKEEG